MEKLSKIYGKVVGRMESRFGEVMKPRQAKKNKNRNIFLVITFSKRDPFSKRRVHDAEQSHEKIQSKFQVKDGTSVTR